VSTVKQLEANRANARFSTGPKSASGKARSSMNACKHGLTAQTVIIGDEDPDQFDACRKALEEQFQPDSLMARELVERLAGIVWRIRRIPKFEAALIEARCDQVRCDAYSIEMRRRLEGAGGATGVALIEDSKHHDALGKLSRHEAALMNQLTKTLQMLHFIQSQRPVEDDPVVDALPFQRTAETPELR
jgi:hypothetical protein